MSREVDERVVSLQFDNSRFERNVSTTMSTLDKLKSKLNFNSAHAFDGLESSAAKVSLNPLHRAFDLLTDKTTWAETAAITAMANISNSAINAGKKMVSALTIDPIKSGFNEYELKMDSIQTIMSSTGESIDVVNKYLDELNAYSDRTIYSFADMTQNIGKFTNAGVKLDDAVAAMKGISNEAAISGANANEASRAMYNLAQSLSMGYVQYIDWKSIENANMATVDFKQNLANMAVQMGTVTQVSDDLYEVGGKTYNLQSLFKDAMKDQWLTSDVLIEQLKMYSDETTELGQRAYAAAGDIKTFSQMWDVLKESAQSGWAQTWQIIVGDLTEAKTMLKRVADPLDELIQNGANLRNMVLGRTFSSGFVDLKNAITDAGLNAEDFEERLIRKARVEGVHIDTLIKEYGDLRNAISANGIPKNIIGDVLDEMTGTIDDSTLRFKDENEQLQHFQDLVKDIWKGDWSANYDEQREREKLLTDAGYEYAKVQELVNMAVDGHTITLEELNSVQMKNLGFTEEQIKKITQLQIASKDTGSEIGKLMEQMSRPNGRFLVLDTLRSIFTTLKNVIKSVQDAFKEVFAEKTATGLWNLINGIHSFVKALEVGKEETETLTHAFSTLFYIIDMAGMGITRVVSFIGQIFSKVFKGTTKETKIFNGDIYETVKHLHDLMQAFNPLEDVFKKIEPILDKAHNSISKFFKMLVDKKDLVSNFIAGFAEGIRDKANVIWATVVTVFKTMLDKICEVLGIHSPSREMYKIGVFIVQGLINGLKAMWGKLEDVIDNMFGGNGLHSLFGNIRGKVVTTGASRITQGISEESKSLIIENQAAMTSLNNMVESTNAVPIMDKLKSFFEGLISKLKDFVGSIDKGTVLSLLLMLGISKTVKKLVGVTETITKPINGLVTNVSGIAGNIAKMIKQTGDIAEGIKKYVKAQTFKTYAESVLLIATSMILVVYAMKKLNDVKWSSVFKGIIVIGALGALVIALSRFGAQVDSAKDAVKAIATSGVMLSLGIALSGIAVCIGILMVLFKIDSGATLAAIVAVATILIGLDLLIKSLVDTASHASLKDFAKLSLLFLSLSISLGIIAATLALLSTFKPERLGKMAAIFGGFIVLIAIMTKFMNGAKVSAGVGVMFLGFAASMISIALALKMIGSMSPEEIAKGLAVIVVMGIVFIALTAFAQNVANFKDNGTEQSMKLFMNKGGAGLGAMFIGFAVSMLIMAAAIKMIGSIGEEELLKGVAVIVVLSIVMDVMMLFAKGENNHMLGVAATLIAASISIAILAALAVVLGSISWETALQGCLAVAALATSLAIVMHNAKDIDPESEKVLGVITGCIVTLGTVLIAMGAMKPERTLSASVALTAVMLSLALVFNQVSKINPKKGTVAILVTMSICISIMAAAVTVLAKITDTTAALKAAGAISMVMLALMGTLIIINKFPAAGGLKTVAALGTIVLLTAVVAALAFMFSKMQGFDTDKMMKQAIILGSCLLVLAGVAGICAAIGSTGLAAIYGVVILDALLASLIGIATWGIRKVVELFVELAPDIKILGEVFKSLGENLKPLAEVSSMTNATSIDAITAFFGAVEKIAQVSITSDSISVAQALRAFSEELPSIARSMVEFSNILTEGNFDAANVEAAASAGEMIAKLERSLPRKGGKLEEWIGKKESLIAFGGNLRNFAYAIKEFSSVISADGGINYAQAESAANAGLAIAKLEKSLPRSGGKLESFIGKRETMYALGNHLRNFGYAIKQFAEVINGEGIDYKLAEDAGNAGMVVAKLEKALPRSGGSIENFIGKKETMYAFGSHLRNFGYAIKQFAIAIQGDEIDYSVAETAANAGLAVAKLEESLPRNGGKIDEWLGKKESMLAFGGNLRTFAYAMLSFSHILTSDGGIDTEAVEAAARAGSSFAELENGLTKHGGKFQNIFGDADLHTFGNDLGYFGQGIAAYAENTKDMTLTQEQVDASINAATALAGLESSLEGHGSIFEIFTGDDNLEDFGNRIAKFGKGIADFANAIGDTSTGKLQTGTSSIKDFNDFADNYDQKKIDKLAKIDNMENFKIGIVKYAEAMNGFYEKFKDVDSYKLKAASESMAALLTATAGITENSYGGLSNLTADMANMGTVSVDNFCKEFTNADTKVEASMKTFVMNIKSEIKTYYPQFTAVGTVLIDKLAKGVNNGEAQAKKDIGINMDHIVDVIEEHYQDWYDAGGYVVSGFADGITENISKAFNSAGELATDALKGLTLTLDIHSPSRETFKIGEYTVAGLVNALDAGSKSVGLAAEGVGESTKKGMNAAIDNILNGLDSIDTNPVIRPVLDLDDFNTNLGKMNGMLLDTTPTMNAKLNTIGKAYGGLYERNDPLLDAINKMQTGNNVTNIIEGITYDDGSNINDAVATLIDAAMVGRRV